MVDRTKIYTSPRWAFFKRRLIGNEKDVYLDRLYVLLTPWFGILLHHIKRPDRQRDLHDHPFNFISFILRGNYLENTPEGLKRHFWINIKKAEDRHSIREIDGKVLTLLFVGRRRREWGFWVDGGTRFVKWTEYDKLDQP